MKHRLVVCLLVICIFSCFISCKRVQSTVPKVKTKTFFTYFDTAITVYSYAEETDEQFEATCKLIDSEYEKYNELFDIYHEYSGITNLCTVNNHTGETLIVDSEIVDLLQYAKDCYYLTNGKVNVMFGSVLKLWKQGVPTTEELEKAFKHCDINSLVLNSESNTVLITDKFASIDVGAIAKGYATEKIAELLKEKGVTSFIINAGGNVKLIGQKPKDVDWQIAISNPNKESNEYAQVLQLHDTSCVTSGLYERPNHIIDTDTLQPPQYFASVSIITKDSAYADVLSTALFCMSYEDGYELQKQLGDFEVVWVKTDGTILR